MSTTYFYDVHVSHDTQKLYIFLKWRI